MGRPDYATAGLNCTAKFPLNIIPVMSAIASPHKSVFLWRGKSRSHVLFALLLTAWLTVGTSSFPLPSANGWGKENGTNSPRQSLILTWAISSTSYMQLNISFSPWQQRQGRGKGLPLGNPGTWALLWSPTLLWDTRSVWPFSSLTVSCFRHCLSPFLHKIWVLFNCEIYTSSKTSIILKNQNFLHSGQTRSSRSSAAGIRTSKVTSSPLFSSLSLAFLF